MPKKYSPEAWDLDSLLDSTRYESLRRCVSFVEDQVDQFDDRNETEFADEFGDVIQAAFLMSVIAQMEHHLKKICEILAELRNLIVRPTDLRGANGFDSCVAFLRKILQVPLPESELKMIRAVVELRNAWVHQGGYLDQIPEHLGPARRYLQRDTEGKITFCGPFVQRASRACQTFVRQVEVSARGQSGRWARRKKDGKSTP